MAELYFVGKYRPPAIPAQEGVAKSLKALNHKGTKAQRKTFLPAGRSLSKPGRNFVSSCLCGSILLEAFCDKLLRENDGCLRFCTLFPPPGLP